MLNETTAATKRLLSAKGGVAQMPPNSAGKGREKLPPGFHCRILLPLNSVGPPGLSLAPEAGGLQAQLLLQTGAGPMKWTSLV